MFGLQGGSISKKLRESDSIQHAGSGGPPQLNALSNIGLSEKSGYRQGNLTGKKKPTFFNSKKKLSGGR